jgi:hypothetical protein
VALLLAGCSTGPDFVQIKPGVAVSSESIDEYARRHGISREEAKTRLAAEVTTTAAAGAGD